MGAKPQFPRSLINRIYAPLADDIHFAVPISSLRTSELELVRGVLRMLQGFSGSLFFWDHVGNNFRVKSGIYLTHLSQRSLHSLLNQFMHAATCLQLVEITVNKVEKSVPKPPPTLKAFVCSASAWLKRLRNIALKEEIAMSNVDGTTIPTLLGLASSLSSLCSGGEYLLQIVYGTIPSVYFEIGASIPAAELAVHVLDYLYKKLDEICLVQGGEEEAYHMVLYMFVGSLLPYIEGLDSWLFEGTLDDPSNEMFFFANKEVSVDGAEFWEKSCLLRLLQHSKLDVESSTINSASNDSMPTPTDRKEMGRRDSVSLSGTVKGKEHSIRNHQACPYFMKDLAKSIVSAGKSLQLMRHVPMNSLAVYSKGSDCEIGSTRDLESNLYGSQSISGLTLSEVFCVSLAGLVGDGDHICKYFLQDDWHKYDAVFSFASCANEQDAENDFSENSPVLPYLEKIWYKFLSDTLLQKKSAVSNLKQKNINDNHTKDQGEARDLEHEMILWRSCIENPVITPCQTILRKNRATWKTLNLSQNFCLPALNDEILRTAIFAGDTKASSDNEGTNYTCGFQFGESEYLRSQDERKLLEMLFPFPALLPSFQDELPVSELLPFQRNSTLPSRVLLWMQNIDLRATPPPLVIMQHCLTAYIQKQVDYVGRHILLKLMDEWRLMDELAVLRAIYLLGSGDLLQHFLTVIFNKLDKGETWDDDFELNTILQESIRNSADRLLLSTPDSLVVSITYSLSVDSDEQPATVSTPRKSHAHSFGIDGLDMLKFTYKVPWPLELIANTEAIKKYNQVMRFLLKVKRAKFVLDKVRRWMWKGRGSAANNSKHHWLVEQKLLQFVDAFHQYVMDRVYHSAWRELCEGMTAAKSLDEVIEVHEAYMLSIQRQCFVVPDKLWALIASRINSILGLALDFYNIQQTLGSGGAVSAIKARCEMEVDRIERQFDDCIAFLLRVLSFKLNVGNFPHLADLVTRINYNYFYMSATGNLRTGSGSGSVTSRSGKASDRN
ncbi:uncharacterized protein LOC114716793 isoform X2 [Neltuma alba]|uniref:uncharacterized protein LOC114716793 isoform X2 n=1 Tax=Neltuma alba TaxID=207710 RepID=UPI0010A59C84|nr:uncharacterized protein LOC114716793 isoform X2 [Prosopis alba]